MVMRRSGDIKRISKDVSDTLEDNPKRTKVHAQRKFAQGSGMNSPVMTPVKDKEKVKVNGTSSSPELLPSKRPRTEDFLTYLCFRGTEALPPSLDFFNLASKSTKQDKDGSTPGSSKQTSASQQENKAKRVRSKLKKTKAVHSLKNKLHEKRLGTRSTRLSQKISASSSLHTRQRQLEDRPKKVGNVAKKQLVRGRPAHHPAILKRLGAARLRTGLRSGGQLPPGSDVGIKSDRKPRKKLIRTKASKSKKETISRSLASRKKSKDKESDDEDDEDEEEERRNEKNKKDDKAKREKKIEESDTEESESKEVKNEEPARKKSCRMSTRSRASSGSPANPPNTLNLPSRPTRKSKESATLYMEMLTKDLRSPEEEEDDSFGKISTENSPSNKKSLDESSVSTVSSGRKSSKQSKTDDQSADKEKSERENSVASRASRRGGRMKREDEQLNKDDVRITRRQQKIGIQQRGRPALRRGRGRPPLTRTPPFQRVLRNVRKVTNFAENDSETEDEEDEMFVESILSEEMEKLDMDSNKSKTAKSSISSSAKLSKSNVKKVEDVGSDNESEASEQSVKEKTVNRCKTRSHSNSKTNKSVDESSEEDSRRLTRGSNKEKKEEDSVKERKRSLPSRKSRPSKSDSDTERNDNTPKEKLPQKRGRKDSVEKIKEKEIPEKEKPAEDTKVESLPETRTGSCSSASKKSFLQDKKEEEDQSVAYLLLSLAQGKGYETETACQPAAGDITTRNTRSFVKEPPKEEARGKRGKRRNTSLDNSVNEENFIEEKPLTSMKRNKRESVASETSSSKFSKTRLSSKDSKDKLNTDDEQDDSFDIKDIKTEDQALRKVQKKEPVSSRNKVQDKVSSDSDEEKVTGRKSLKSNSDDGSALLSSRRARRFRASRDANENSSGSEIDSKVKDKADIMTEKKDRLRRRSGGLVKNESFDSEIGDIKRDIKTEPKLKKHGSLQSFGTASVKSESCDVQEVNLINSTQKTEERKVNNSNVESLTVNSLIEDSILNVNAINKVLDMIEDVNSLTSGENVKMVTAGKGSLDYSSNQSTSFDDSKTISDKTKGRKTNTDKAEVNIANLNSNELFRGNSIKETSDVRSAVDGNKTCKPEEFKEKDTKREVKSSSFGSSTSVQNKRSEDNSSSSEESDTELNCKSGKDIDRSRKRFPRRSRTEYNRDLPKRTLHTRKVKTMNDKYIEDDSSSSESSSTSSDDAPIAAVKSQKRIKPKNSTQNDAIESAIREAQNAKREEITSQCSKIESYLNKNVYNLPLQTPDKKDSTSENIIQTDFIPRSQIPVTTNSVETRPRENEIVAEKVQIVHQKSPAKVTENSTLIANKSSNKFFNAEKIPHGNIALMTPNVNVPSNDSLGKQGNLESEKKQSMSETWRQAFKNAKIPKPGQSSPVPHGVKPFVRKPFGSPALSTKQSEPMKGVYQNLSKLPNTMNQFKSNPFQSMGKYSPNRPFPNGEESKSQSPSRRAIDMRDSPSKSSVSSSDDSKVPLSDNKKPNEVPVKSLTQLQYEKRSSELISSLKDAPLIIDPAYPVAPFTSLKEAVIEASPSRAAKPASPSPMKPAAEGKHLNLPLAVEHTLRKRSPITVSKKPVVNKSLPQTDKKITPVPVIDKQKEVNEEIKEEPAIIEPHNGDATAPRTSNIEILGKKKVNMTTEEINRWLDDSTSSGIEHAKDCGIFEKNQCECSYRTSSASMLVGRGVVAGVSTENVNNRGLIPNTSNTGAEIKVERGFVEPPVQLRDFAEIASKFGGEIISTYKVEDYREREMLKHKDNVQKQQRRLSSSLKSDRSMTEEEMCEYDFRSLVEGNAEKPGVSGRRRPEQKVRPLSARAPPPVGTVQPTLREATEQNISNSAVSKVDKPKQASQGTQSSPRPPVSATPVCTNPTATPEPAETLKEKRNMDNVEKNTTTAKTENTAFPQHAVPDGAKMLEAPTFYPTEKEFGDPLEYIEKITPLAQHLGICRIVPPPSFKPECKVSDDMRFTAYNQYIHKMYHRWGPNVREMSAIRKYLATQNIALNQPPWIGGIEVDLPRLYQTVQQCGGLKEVYEKKRWTKVADVMKIPKSAQDRVTKLDDIYCKFLLPYDTLSHSERSKLLEEVEVEWKEREKRMMEQDEEEEKEEGGSDSESDSDERDECITKGKSVALSGFFRTARNTMSTWFSKDSTPSPSEVENEFWRHVTTGTAHVCVQSGSIDTSTWGCGFPSVKERSSARHPWNLKILTNNPRSILRSLGPVIGVTVPTLHVGMLFSACCWYRDPHALPWIEYLHTGASKIWYGVPDSLSEELKIAVKRLMPRYCREKKKIWLASDTVMVPPQLLVEHGVSVCKTVQEPGQFVVVFPRAFTSSLCTGYSVSESVYFAHSSWLDTSRSVFKDIQESSEPPIFSLEKLLFNIATDIRTSADVLTQILPMVIEFRDEEISRRKILEGFGLVADEKLPVTKGRRTKSQEEPNEYECEICRGNLFLSLVTNTQDEINYCLVHAIEVITKDKDVLTHCKLMYAYDEDEMEELIKKIKTKIETKSQKKQGKHSITNNSSGSSKT